MSNQEQSHHSGKEKPLLHNMQAKHKEGIGTVIILNADIKKCSESLA
jgi:hypothetical protein